jgi:hypothetical protein
MTDVEVWRTIAAAPDYAVSNLGRIRRDTRGQATQAGRVLKPKVARDGYLSIQFPKYGDFLVHRLVAVAFLGDPPTPAHEAAHFDGDRGNARASNLRWATKKENIADKQRHGTNGNKLTEADVRAIRHSCETGVALAAKYGVHYNSISAIRTGASWGWCR